MKTWQCVVNNILGVGVVALAIALPLNRLSGDEIPKPESLGKPKLRIKVLTITRGDPSAAHTMLHGLLQSLTAAEMVASSVGGRANPGGMGFPGGGVPGMAGPGVGLGFGGGAGLGGGIAGTWRVSLDDRTGSLVVRGTERDLAIAADLVAVLNTPADKPFPKLKHLRAYRLQHAEPGDLVGLFTQMDLGVGLTEGSEGSRLMLAVGPEDMLLEIDEVVKALDVKVPKKDE